LSIIGLLFLLLPFLLFTTSPQQLAALGIRLPSPGESAPSVHMGPVQDLIVTATDLGVVVSAEIQRQDVRAAVGDVEQWSRELPPVQGAMDLLGLQSTLRQIKSQDPSRNRITVAPSDSTTTGDLVDLMDAVREDREGALFSEVALEGLSQ
jgi:biopolymer transport protein ExbD